MNQRSLTAGPSLARCFKGLASWQWLRKGARKRSGELSLEIAAPAVAMKRIGKAAAWFRNATPVPAGNDYPEIMQAESRTQKAEANQRPEAIRLAVMPRAKGRHEARQPALMPRP